MLKALAAALALAGAVAHADPKVLPPESRTFESPGRAYRLEVQGPPGWRTPQARAELFQLGPAGPRRLWSQTLPQRFGPGLALVSDSGRVLLLDEGMRVTSDRAIVALSRDGRETARRSMAQVAGAAGVPAETLVRTATVGPWMSAAPALPPGAEAVTLHAGGVALSLDLATGRLTRVHR